MTPTILYQLRTTLKENQIVFCYSGYVTERILSSIGETIKMKLEAEETDMSTTKKVFSIFVEGVQNVIRYSAERIDEEEKETDLDLRYGLIVIGNTLNNGIFIQCGNLILNEDIKMMKLRINEIEGKNKEELKKLYKKKMLEGPEKHSKGASLGLVEMARRSGQPMEFEFESVNDTYSFFCVKAIV